MANHGFVTTRKKLTPEQVDQDIREIVLRRFGGNVEVEYNKCSKNPPSKGSHNWWAHWEMKAKARFPKDVPDYMFEFAASIMSPHRLDFRHPHADWAFWAQMAVQEELALKYDGTVSDEGVSERWKVTPKTIEKYQHYRVWVHHRWLNPALKLDASTKALREKWVDVELAYTPEPLRSL
jgi:hypothetical protein